MKLKIVVGVFLSMLLFQSAWAITETEEAEIVATLMLQCEATYGARNCTIIEVNENDTRRTLSDGTKIIRDCPNYVMYLPEGSKVFIDQRLFPSGDQVRGDFIYQTPKDLDSLYRLLGIEPVSQEFSVEIPGEYRLVLELLNPDFTGQASFTVVVPDFVRPLWACNEYSLPEAYQTYLNTGKFPVQENTGLYNRTCQGFFIPAGSEVTLPIFEDTDIRTHRAGEILTSVYQGYISGSPAKGLSLIHPQEGEVGFYPYVIGDGNPVDFTAISDPVTAEDYVIILPVKEGDDPQNPITEIEQIISDFQEQFASKITDSAKREKVEQYISAVFTALDEAGFTPKLQIAFDENGRVMVRINMIVQNRCNRVERAKTEARVNGIIVNTVKTMIRMLSK